MDGSIIKNLSTHVVNKYWRRSIKPITLCSIVVTSKAIIFNETSNKKCHI